MSEEAARRAARSSWPSRIRRLDDESGEDDGTTAEQRLGMMWELVEQAWALAGKTIPVVDRAHMPIRVRRLGEDPDEP